MPGMFPLRRLLADKQNYSQTDLSDTPGGYDASQPSKMEASAYGGTQRTDEAPASPERGLFNSNEKTISTVQPSKMAASNSEGVLDASHASKFQGVLQSPATIKTMQRKHKSLKDAAAASICASRLSKIAASAKALQEVPGVINVARWTEQVVDLQRVLDVMQGVYLLVQHHNEAIVRVALELVLEKDSSKILSWVDGSWNQDDERRAWFRSQVSEKLLHVFDMHGVTDTQSGEGLRPSEKIKRLEEALAKSLQQEARAQRAEEWELRAVRAEAKLAETESELAKALAELERQRDAIALADQQAKRIAELEALVRDLQAKLKQQELVMQELQAKLRALVDKSKKEGAEDMMKRLLRGVGLPDPDCPIPCMKVWDRLYNDAMDRRAKQAERQAERRQRFQDVQEIQHVESPAVKRHTSEQNPGEFVKIMQAPLPCRRQVTVAPGIVSLPADPQQRRPGDALRKCRTEPALHYERSQKRSPLQIEQTPIGHR